MIRDMARLRALRFLAIVGLTACEQADPESEALTPADYAAIARLDSTFVDGWLKDDTTAALSVFAPDAVLQPPNSQPLTGLEAIRSFWWPSDGSQTRISKFTSQTDELSGDRNIAYRRGRSELSWTYTKGGKSQNQTGRSNSLTILRRDSTGRWSITRQIWNAAP
jgi:uncharacterized protein (TIGR02246 family)